MVKIMNFLFFAQKVSSGSGAFLGGLVALEPPKIGGKRSPEGVQICLFSLFIFIIYSFIHLIHNYFPILLVCDQCEIFLNWNVL